MPPPRGKNFGRYGDRRKPKSFGSLLNLAKKREFQKSSRGVNTKVLTPPAQRPKFFLFPASSFFDFESIVNDSMHYYVSEG